MTASYMYVKLEFKVCIGPECAMLCSVAEHSDISLITCISMIDCSPYLAHGVCGKDHQV